jgi:hypothetical protein
MRRGEGTPPRSITSPHPPAPLPGHGADMPSCRRVHKFHGLSLNMATEWTPDELAALTCIAVPVATKSVDLPVTIASFEC